MQFVHIHLAGWFNMKLKKEKVQMYYVYEKIIVDLITLLKHIVWKLGVKLFKFSLQANKVHINIL